MILLLPPLHLFSAKLLAACRLQLQASLSFSSGPGVQCVGSRQ